jgi:transposase
MSSTSFLYHALGLRDQEYIKTEYIGGEVYFHIRTKESKLKCSKCESKEVIKRGSTDRIFRTLPIGFKPLYLVAKVQRLECKSCGLVRQERLTYAEEKKAIPLP